MNKDEKFLIYIKVKAIILITHKSCISIIFLKNNNPLIKNISISLIEIIIIVNNVYINISILLC